MRILMISAAISPYGGSELYAGWLWATASARVADHVHLLVPDWCGANLLRAETENLLPGNITYECIGKARFRAPKGSFGGKLFSIWEYIEFLRMAEQIAQKRIHSGEFAVVHQTTLETWRNGFSLETFAIPSVWGPIGGGEKFPFQFLSILSNKGKLLEIARVISSVNSQNNPRIRKSIREVDVIIATNQETRKLLDRCGRSKPVLTCPNVLMESRMGEIVAANKKHSKSFDNLQLFSGGGIEGRKGIALALKAVKLCHQAGLKLKYIIGGHGHELPSLISLSNDLELSEVVQFRPDLVGDEYLKTLAETHLFLFPSLRDNSPLTLIEAMAAGAVPIVFSLNGPGEMVQKDSGVRLVPKNPENAVQEIFEAITALCADRVRLAELAAAAAAHAKSHLSFSKAENVIREAYKTAIEIHKRKL